MLSAAAKGYLEEMVADDSAIYEAGVAKHFEQRAQFSKFDQLLDRFQSIHLLLDSPLMVIRSMDSSVGMKRGTYLR